MDRCKEWMSINKWTGVSLLPTLCFYVLNGRFQCNFLLPFHSSLSSISFHTSPSKECFLSFLKFIWNLPAWGAGGGISVTGIWSLDLHPPDTVPVNSDLLCLSCISPELLVFCFIYLNFHRSNLKVLARFCQLNRNIHLRPRSLIFSTKRSSLLCNCEGLAFYLSLLLKQDIPGMST